MTEQETIKNKIALLNAEAEILTKQPNFTKQSKASFDLKLQQISDLRSQLKTLTTTDDERRQRARQVALEIGGPDALLTKEERASVRSLLLAQRAETRTYSAMSDSNSGQLIPTGFYDRLTLALKLADGLFDDSVSTPLYTDTGAPMTAPFVNDTGASASVVAENSQSTETEPATISRVSFSKCPTYRSGQLVFSLELAQDSAFPLESIATTLAAKRLQRGVGQAGVTSLLSGASAGVLSGTTNTVVMDDVLSLLGSLDSAYLSGKRAFVAMNRATMLSLMKQKSTTGSYIWRPKYDESGRPLLAGVPCILCPSLPNVATGNRTIVAGDFSALIHRQVRSVDVRRYQQNIALVENGMAAIEIFARHDWAIIDSAALKYLTVS